MKYPRLAPVPGASSELPSPITPHWANFQAVAHPDNITFFTEGVKQLLGKDRKVGPFEVVDPYLGINEITLYAARQVGSCGLYNVVLRKRPHQGSQPIALFTNAKNMVERKTMIAPVGENGVPKPPFHDHDDRLATNCELLLLSEYLSQFNATPSMPLPSAMVVHALKNWGFHD